MPHPKSNRQPNSPITKEHKGRNQGRSNKWYSLPFQSNLLVNKYDWVFYFDEFSFVLIIVAVEESQETGWCLEEVI